jgi:hypothetical protein
MEDCEKLFSFPTFTDHITLHSLNHKNDWFPLKFFHFSNLGNVCWYITHHLIPKCSKFLKILVFLAWFSKLSNLGIRKKVHFHTLLQHKQQTWCTPPIFSSNNLNLRKFQGPRFLEFLWHVIRSFLLVLHFILFISQGFNKYVI